MRQLFGDLAEVRRARRDVQRGLNAKWDEEGVRRPRWWGKGLVWGGAVLGVCLLALGDTVDRVFGVAFLVMPAVLAGINAWMYWKAVRLIRETRRG